MSLTLSDEEVKVLASLLSRIQEAAILEVVEDEVKEETDEPVEKEVCKRVHNVKRGNYHYTLIWDAIDRIAGHSDKIVTINELQKACPNLTRKQITRSCQWLVSAVNAPIRNIGHGKWQQVEVSE